MSERFSRELLTIPNIMSLFRIAAAPVLALLWLGLGWHAAGLAIGTVVGLTDQLDGYMARRLNQITELGGLIDQLGDLVFESTCLIIAVLSGHLWSGWLILYLFREFTVTVIRSYVTGHGSQLPSSMLGKVKSSCLQWAFFLVFIGAILAEPGMLPATWRLVGITPGQMIIWIGNGWIIGGIVVGIISAVVYFRAFTKFYSSRQAAGQ